MQADVAFYVMAGCTGGPCPKIGIRPARPGRVLFQGARLAPGERESLGYIPDHEDVVELPEEVVLEYARRLLAEGRL